MTHPTPSIVRLISLGLLCLLIPHARGAGFTIQLPPLPFPPKITFAGDSVPQIGIPTTITVRAKGQPQRRLDLSVSHARHCERNESIQPKQIAIITF